jgi:hypothetical protein
MACCRGTGSDCFLITMASVCICKRVFGKMVFPTDTV